MVEYQDLAITGALVAALPESERWFEIIEKPYYEEIQSFNDKNKKVEKLAVRIRLSNDKRGTYYPNKRSHRAMMRITNDSEMDNWVGKKFIWGKILDMLVGDSGEKQVLFVTEAYPKEVKA